MAGTFFLFFHFFLHLTFLSFRFASHSLPLLLHSGWNWVHSLDFWKPDILSSAHFLLNLLILNLPSGILQCLFHHFPLYDCLKSEWFNFILEPILQVAFVFFLQHLHITFKFIYPPLQCYVVVVLLWDSIGRLIWNGRQHFVLFSDAEALAILANGNHN